MSHRILIDTHVLLWALTDDGRLSESGRDLLVVPASEVFVSAASTWEMGIKQGLGKLRVPDDLFGQLDRARFTHLPITLEHGRAVSELPAHHSDPFDRLLVAQAQCEGLSILTADRAFAAYDVEIVRL